MDGGCQICAGVFVWIPATAVIMAWGEGGAIASLKLPPGPRAQPGALSAIPGISAHSDDVAIAKRNPFGPFRKPPRRDSPMAATGSRQDIIMPLFDFECVRCGQVNEHLVMGAEQPKCPNCGSDELKKLIGVPAPAGKSKGIIARARQRAAAEGHLSNFSPSERGARK